MQTSDDNRRNWKGITVNYDLLVTPSAVQSDCCYCLNLQQIQAILAMIEPLQWVTRYYSPSETVIDSDLVDAFYAGIVEDLMSNCDDETVAGSVLHRIDPTTGLYQFSVDGGTTWMNSSSDPRISGTIFPPVPASDTQKCDAAVNAKNQVAKLVSQTIAAKTASEDYVQILTIIASIIAAWFGAEIGGLIVSLFGKVINALLAADAAALAAAFTDTVYNEVQCLFFVNSGSDGRFDDTTRAALLADIPTRITDSYARDFLAGLLPLMGVLGLNNLTAQGTSEGATCDCTDCAFDSFTTYYGTEISRAGETISVTGATDGSRQSAGFTTSDDSLGCHYESLVITAGSPTIIHYYWIEVGHDVNGSWDGEDSAFAPDHTLNLNRLLITCNAVWTGDVTFGGS